MKVKKIVVVVTVEVLSIDSVYSKLIDCAKQIDQEVVAGKLRFDDGDQVSWDTRFGLEQEI